MTTIVKSIGTTDSERYLAKLCEHTFLGLWAYPNLYTDEGRRNDKGVGEELCDLLVMSGNTVALFSDKSIAFNSSIDLKIAWPRWYRRAIRESAKQIRGAEKWIREHPDRIFLDKHCQNPFPLLINEQSELRFHRILVTRNTRKAVESFFGGKSSGSFILMPHIRGNEHFDIPFHIGTIDDKDGYIHVLDETSLDQVLRELDTSSDFFDYLSAKEDALAAGRILSVPGEEELLGYYLLEGGHIPSQPITYPRNVNKELGSSGLAGGMLITEGFWSSYIGSDEYIAIKEANAPSYFWDQLIERFTKCVIDGTIVGPDPRVASHEEALRVLASERRLSRRTLAENLIDKFKRVPHNHRSGRVVSSLTYPDLGYVFLFYPRDPGEDYESYRLERTAVLQSYILVCKRRFPRFTRICGIATEPQQCEGRSEDIMVMELPSLSDEECRLADQISREERILTEVKTLEGRTLLVPTREKHKPKLGRNDRCFCGSGKKYKHCCLK